MPKNPWPEPSGYFRDRPFQGKSVLESWQDEMIQVYAQQLNEPGPLMNYFTMKPKAGDTMPNKVTFGRLVRIPSGLTGEGRASYNDVTVKQAKREAKRLRKLAKQIEKATR